MYEDIIEEIMKEVLHRLKSYENTCIHKKSLLVLPDGLHPPSEAITKEYNLLIPNTDSSDNTKELYGMVSSAEVILITSVAVKQLAGLALLNGGGYLEEAIRYALLLGKKIFVLEEGLEYRSYKVTANKTFYRRLLEYEECLRQYGIIFTSESAFPFSEKQVKQTVPRKRQDDSKGITSFTKANFDRMEEQVELKKKLILEKDLMNLNIKSQAAICIEKDSIITPSALDFARAHHMRFIKM
jgi:ethanolamine utilization protein